VSTLAGDFWVCGDCRSINNAGAGQCYNCRSSRDAAAVDPADIDKPTTATQSTDVPAFRSSRSIAALASILILGVAVMQVIQTVATTSLFVQILDGVAATGEQNRYVTNLMILTLGVGALALIGWGLWLSRTVTSMPALGLGEPPVTGLRAFVETFIPVLNLVRVPAIVRDIVTRLDAAGGRMHVLGFAAWVGLLVGFIVPRISWFFLDLGGATSDEAIRSQLLFDALGTVVVVTSAIFLVALIWWVEGRVQRRRATQLGDARPDDRATSRPAQPVMRPAPEPDPVQARPAFAAAGGAWAASAVATPSTTSPGHPASEPLAAATAVAVASPPIEAPTEPSVKAPAPEPVPAPAPVVAPAAEAEAPIVAPAADASAVTPAPAPAPARRTEPTEAAQPAPVPPEAASAAVRPPHLTIKVASHGMMTAELDGQTEHIILDDLTAYGSALSKAGGSASIVAPQDDDMARLIARRAHRILEDAGVSITTA
jgi:hypothetical protein